MKTMSDFHKLMTETKRPVVLVEGIRKLPEGDVENLVRFAGQLAESYPDAMFRTGNAGGSDEAFAEGIMSVDPKRLECVLPYAGHRKKAVHKSSYQIPMSNITKTGEERIVRCTTQSSPKYISLIEKRNHVPKLKAKSNYLLRDTLKVIGSDELGLAPATVGIFYVNEEDPMKGGTGHTIRVCEQNNVPVLFQDQWMG